MKNNLKFKSITFIIMILVFAANINTGCIIHAEPETMIPVENIESSAAVQSTSNEVIEIPQDINHIQVTAQYVNHNKKEKKEENSDFMVTKILILVVGIAIICFSIFWIKKRI